MIRLIEKLLDKVGSDYGCGILAIILFMASGLLILLPGKILIKKNENLGLKYTWIVTPIYTLLFIVVVICFFIAVYS